MKIYAASLSCECNFDTCPSVNMKVAGASLSVMPVVPADTIASLALECNFDTFPAVSMKVAGASLSLITQYAPATVVSLSLVRRDGYVQLIDLKKGTAIMIERST
jgi:hypothetical protein